MEYLNIYKVFKYYIRSRKITFYSTDLFYPKYYALFFSYDLFKLEFQDCKKYLHIFLHLKSL